MAGKRRRGRWQDRVELEFLEGVRRRIGDEPDLLRAMGDLYTRTGRYAEALEADRKLVELLPEDAMAWYNLACSLALVGRATDALDSLERAVELGYDDPEWMSRDEDLKSLHGEDRFEALLREIAE